MAMNDSAENTEPRFRQKVFFWCWAAVSLVALLGSNSLFWMEPRIAEAAREITVTGRWYPLTVNFREYSGMPLLEVWSVALIFEIGVSESAARLPSALAAIALLSGTWQLTKQLFGRRFALLTGWLTLGSFGVLYMGRCCAPGMFSAAFAVWATVLYLRGVGRKSFWRALGLSALLALGVLNRGPGFLWLPGALLLPWMLTDRRPFDLRVAAGVAIAAAGLYLAWFFIFGEPVAALGGRLWRIAAEEGVPTAFRRWGKNWWNGRVNPVWTGFVDVPLVMMPWAPIMLAALVGALGRLRKLPRDEKCLLTGILLGFLVLAFPASSLRTDFLPLVPFLALETGVWALRGEEERLNRWAVAVTRTAIMTAASFATVALVTIPVWSRMLNLTLPPLFWAAGFLFGASVLAVMMLDSYPTQLLPRLTGLPEPLAAMVLGGTLASICLISFLLPSLRELREEKPFLLAVKRELAREKLKTIVDVGGVDSAALLLFYTDVSRPVATVSDRCDDDAVSEFVRAAAGAKDGRVAVIALYGDREQKFLRRCAEAAKLKIDVGKPDRLESVPSGCALFCRRSAFYLAEPAGGAGQSEESTNVRNKGI